jgi:hypothetical protein
MADSWVDSLLVERCSIPSVADAARLATTGSLSSLHIARIIGRRPGI